MIPGEIQKKTKQTIESESRPIVWYLDDENPMCRSPELKICVIVGDVLNPYLKPTEYLDLVKTRWEIESPQKTEPSQTDQYTPTD